MCLSIYKVPVDCSAHGATFCGVFHILGSNPEMIWNSRLDPPPQEVLISAMAEGGPVRFDDFMNGIDRFFGGR